MKKKSRVIKDNDPEYLKHLKRYKFSSGKLGRIYGCDVYVTGKPKSSLAK